MELSEILKRRKSVRSFQQVPVPRGVLAAVVATARHAPSAGFTQGNEYLVLDSPDAIADFFRLMNGGEADADDPQRGVLPTAVVIPIAHKQAYLDRYSEPDKAPYGLGVEENWAAPYWFIDAGMASMLILLAAIEHGLGAWFSGIAVGEAEIVSRFGIPDALKPIGWIALGYATPVDDVSVNSSARTRPRRTPAELTHFNGW